MPPPVPPPPHSPYPSCPAAVPSQMSRHRRLHAPAAPAPRCFATAALFAPRGTAARQMPNALGIGPIKQFAAGSAMRAMRDCRKRARHRACRDIRGCAAAGLGSWGGGGGKAAACGLRTPSLQSRACRCPQCLASRCLTSSACRAKRIALCDTLLAACREARYA